jgi:hypothetical protein
MKEGRQLRRCLLRFCQWPVARQIGLVCTHPINDYDVVTSRRGEHPDRWSWKLRRKSAPLGIKMTGDGHRSDMAAQFAGKRALEDFLSDLSKRRGAPVGQ